MWKKYSLLALVLALVSCLILTGCGTKDSATATDDMESSSSDPAAESTEEAGEGKALVAESFAIAALSCDKEGIAACVYSEMAEEYVAAYGENEYVFSNVTAQATDEIVLLRDGLELYTSTLSRDYDVKTTLESASSFTVKFTAEYNGKAYDGTMTVLVATFEGGTYVISAQLDSMEDAFYEDNCPDGDFYFDMHGEE